MPYDRFLHSDNEPANTETLRQFWDGALDRLGAVVETDEQLGQSGSLRCQWFLRSNRNETTIVVSHADEIPTYPEKNMSLHRETAALSRLAAYNKGSVEHLFALIDLCLLIERHNNWILARENR